MQSKQNIRTTLLAALISSTAACTGNLDGSSSGLTPGGAAAGATSSAASGAPALGNASGAASGTTAAGGSAAGDSLAPTLPLWSGAVGSWCGPAEDQTLWLVARPQAQTSSCEVASHELYAEAEHDSADGLTLELPAAQLGSVPAQLTVAGRYCQAASCSAVQVALGLESFMQGQGAKGSWSFTPPGAAELKGRLEASWCAWDDFLPAHPEGERLARDVQIRELAMYQGVKVPIVRDMQAVSVRNADLVQDREALLRVFVEPGPAFQPRQLSARLTLQDAGAEARHFEQTIEVTGPSRDEAGQSTFNLALPKDAFKADTQYSLELREVTRCTALMGTPVGARFPELGLAPIGARETGPVKVMLVPVRYEADGSGRLPDTSPAQLEQMSARSYSMYPTTSVSLTLHDAVATDRTNLEDMLDQMRELRDSDAPPSDLAYYGLVRQAETFRDYCKGSCTTGIAGFGSQNGVAAAGMGIGFLDAAAGTFVHELGHIYRRPHAPCGGAAGADDAYPYPEANLGSWGYDLKTQQLFDPRTHVDFMSYCSPEWISDYNYQQILERIVLVNQRALEQRLVVTGAPQRYRTLMIDAGGQARWGLDLKPKLEPPGDPLRVELLDAAGVATTVIAYEERSGDGRRTLFVPASGAGTRLRVPGLALLDFAGQSSNKPFRR